MQPNRTILFWERENNIKFSFFTCQLCNLDEVPLTANASNNKLSIRKFNMNWHTYTNMGSLGAYDVAKFL